MDFYIWRGFETMNIALLWDTIHPMNLKCTQIYFHPAKHKVLL